MNDSQLMVKDRVKRKIVFAFLMGLVTTGSVSFTVVLINLGISETFWRIWVKSWFLAHLVAFPVILMVAPQMQRFVDFLFKERVAFKKSKKSDTSEKMVSKTATKDQSAS